MIPTSLKSSCSMYITLLMGTLCLPLDSSAGKSGTSISPEWSLGKFVIVTFKGSRTAMALENRRNLNKFQVQLQFSNFVFLN